MQFWKNNIGSSDLVNLGIALVIAFALIYVGIYATGIIEENYDNTGTDADADTERTFDNLSGNLDSSLDIVQVAIIITVLAGAVAAIFLFTRYR